MIVICIGPVCIPWHMLLAFLLGVLHKYGLFTWIKEEWVTYRYWRNRWRRWRTKGQAGAKPPPTQGGVSTASTSQGTAETQAQGSKGEGNAATEKGSTGQQQVAAPGPSDSGVQTRQRRKGTTDGET